MTQRRISAAAKRRSCRRNRNIAPHRRSCRATDEVFFLVALFSGAFTLGRYISCGVPTGERGRNCNKRATNGRPYDLTLVRASPVFQRRIKITSIHFLRQSDRKPWRKPQNFWRTYGKRNVTVSTIVLIPGCRKIRTAHTGSEISRFMPMSRYRATAINVSVLCPFAIKKRAQIKNLRSLLTFVLAFSFDKRRILHQIGTIPQCETP